MGKTSTKVSKVEVVFIAASIGLLIGAVAAIGVIKFLFPNTSPDNDLIEKTNEINKYCPVLIDEGTRFDFVNPIPGNKIQFNYTMVNAGYGYIDTAAAIKFIKPNVIKYLKTNPEMNTIRKNKTIVFYNYKDMNGVFLFKIKIDPEQYIK